MINTDDSFDKKEIDDKKEIEMYKVRRPLEASKQNIGCRYTLDLITAYVEATICMN